MSKTLITNKAVSLNYVGWWIFWMGVQTYLMTNLGFDLETASTDAAITQFIFALAGYSVHTAMRAYQPGLRTSLYILGWGIALTFISVLAIRWLLPQVIMAQPGFEIFLNNTLIVRGAFGFLMIVLVAILTWFWTYVGERLETEQRKEDAIKLSRDAELSRLRQQLQPHFLFNSLNSISALVLTKPEEARKMIQQLSDFLRGTVKKDDSPLVTLEEELNHLQLYLDIEKVRFGHRLNINLEKAEDVLNLKLPSLLLQPIVENAIKFGLYDTVGEITISISARRAENMLCVKVTNPFDPETVTPKHGTGFGLSSVQRRLYLLYYRNDLLSAAQNKNLFITTVKIPQA